MERISASPTCMMTPKPLIFGFATVHFGCQPESCHARTRDDKFSISGWSMEVGIS